MTMQKNYGMLLFALAMVAFLISACGQGASSTPTSNYTPLQVLQKSEHAMKQVTSSHIVIQSNDNIQVSGSDIPTVTSMGTALPSTGTSLPSSGTSQPGNVNISISGTGDQSQQGQQLTLEVDKLKLSEVTQGNNVYVQNSQGKWYVLNKSDFQGVASQFSGNTIDQNTLLEIIQNVQITDHGIQSLNGQNLRHITGTLDKTALAQLINDNAQLKSQFGQQDTTTLLNHTKSFQATVDLWIDESNFYLHRTQLAVNLTADTSATTYSAASTVSVQINTTLDLSNFNKPVTISVPTNATPTNNPATIFGMDDTGNIGTNDTGNIP